MRKLTNVVTLRLAYNATLIVPLNKVQSVLELLSTCTLADDAWTKDGTRWVEQSSSNRTFEIKDQLTIYTMDEHTALRQQEEAAEKAEQEALRQQEEAE